MSLTAKEFTLEKFEHLKKLAGDLFPHKDKKFHEITPPQAYTLNEHFAEIQKKGAFGIYKAPTPAAPTSIGVAPPASVPAASEAQVADALDASIDKVTSGQDTSPDAPTVDADAAIPALPQGEVAHDGTAD